MPNKKKKVFTKENSVKFVLLHGNSQAVNADGETLQNVLVPVGKNYKAGTSLLLSNISAFLEEPAKHEAEPNLEEIIGQFADSDSDVLNLECGMNHLNVGNKNIRSANVEDVSSDDSADYYDVESQFSDTSDNLFHDKELCTVPGTNKDCPENIRIFNSRFEKVLEEYDEDQIGALDDEEICGNLSTDCERVQNLFQSELEHEDDISLEPCDEIVKERVLSYVEGSEDENIVEIITKKRLEYDCESILSTYSNQYNHPTVIKEEKVEKIRILKNPLKKGLTKSQLKALDNENQIDKESVDNYSVSSNFNVRLKEETPEEKRERKYLFKEAKRESRILKKENKIAFKKEKKLQTAQALNVQRTKGIKLL